jgi:hypothetical protein
MGALPGDLECAITGDFLLQHRCPDLADTPALVSVIVGQLVGLRVTHGRMPINNPARRQVRGVQTYLK